MIDGVVAYVRRELRDRLPVSDAEAIMEGARALSRQDVRPGVYITVVGVEHEDSFHLSAPQPRGGPEPLISLRLLLLFSFEFQTYEASLSQLSNTIRLFAEQPVFSAETASPTNPFPVGLRQLTFTPHPLDFEALTRLWSALGAPYLPSVVYEVSGVELARAR